jgi:hypothetical protein
LACLSSAGKEIASYIESLNLKEAQEGYSSREQNDKEFEYFITQERNQDFLDKVDRLLDGYQNYG